MKEKIAAFGSLILSAVLSTCCTLPLALASLGLGSLGLGSVIKPVRPYMIGVALVLLAFGFYRVHSKPSAVKNRALMWVAAVVFLVVVGTPYAVTFFRGDPMEIALEPGTRRVIVQLDDVSYRACCEPPAKDALNALPGVKRVYVNHRSKEAILIVDKDAQIDNATVMRTLEAVNNRGHIKEP